MDKRVALNHAKTHPLQPARIRSGRVVTGTRLARRRRRLGRHTVGRLRGLRLLANAALLAFGLRIELGRAAPM